MAFIQPMIYFKNLEQAQINALQREHISKMYRGGLGFGMSFAPAIALQTVANGVFSHHFPPLFAAALAGMVSAVVIGPAEFVMIQQQVTGKRFLETAKYIHKQYGYRGFSRGVIPTMVREGVFTAACFSATPWMREKFQLYGMNDSLAQWMVGGMVGTTAALISQPFDTWKTQMQRDLSLNMPVEKALFRKNAFAGLKWRCAMVATAVTWIPFAQSRINAWIDRR